MDHVLSNSPWFIGFINMVIFTKKSLTFNKEFWFWSFIIGFLGFNFPFSIIAWGQQYIPSSLTAILMGINPILTLILSYFLLKDEEITTLKIFGILIGFLGLILLIGLNNSDIVDLNSMFMFGQIAVLLGTSSYALATVLTKRFLTYRQLIELLARY